MSDYNRYLVRIKMSHRMDRKDIVRCCQIGGVNVTGSRVAAWLRSQSSDRDHAPMTAAEFDAFTYGIVEWAREAYPE